MKSGIMKKSGQEEAGEIDLTPMLDVVFILLTSSIFASRAAANISITCSLFEFWSAWIITAEFGASANLSSNLDLINLGSI